LFCKNGTFHFDAAEECICKFCDQQCSQYHISKCEAKKISIREAAKMEIYINFYIQYDFYANLVVRL